MSPRRELVAFAATLAALVCGFFAESLYGGKVLSPADVLLASASFRDARGARYEPANRLLMDPVLQFQPWLEFNRSMLRRGRLPLWNPLAGCGAPHLANGQSAVFDPFHTIAYIGTLPDAHAWMAAARLWVAGIGMFLLARSWGFRRWGRWFSGLTFPFCGFLVVWLLYPVTSVAVWMPWIFLATDHCLDRPGSKAVGALAIVTGLVVLGGHVQTSAHVLLAVGLYVIWRVTTSRPNVPARWGPTTWIAGVGLGLVVAAIEIVPLGAYLGKSPVWGDRAAERTPAWKLSRPRLLDSVCTAFPYTFGSQRRGHPHLGRALGVHNLNESAGGFAGLATLLWLAPLAWSMRRLIPRVRFLAGLACLGAFGAFRLPPVDNLLRALPVVDVTDNRRLALWLAFGLILLGGVGLDRLSARRCCHPATRLWTIAAILLVAASVGIGRLEPLLRAKALSHYTRTAAAIPGADLSLYRARAAQQVDLTLRFYPWYLGIAAAHLLCLVGLAELWRRGRVTLGVARSALLVLTLVDLVGFGFGLNPAIDRADDRVRGPLIAFLEREIGSMGRIVGVGEELPPNTLMRYGLADVRNYDSVELTRSLDWFAPLYEPGKGLTSRRDVTWAGVIRARSRLQEASVLAAVGPYPPPPGAFERVVQVGSAWVAFLAGAPYVELSSSPDRTVGSIDSGEISLTLRNDKDQDLIIRETFDLSWRAEIDGRLAAIAPYRGTFLSVRVPEGTHKLVLHYDPYEVRLASRASIFGLFLAFFALTTPRPFRSTRIIVARLGRTQAAELESVLSSSPANH